MHRNPSPSPSIPRTRIPGQWRLLLLTAVMFALTMLAAYGGLDRWNTSGPGLQDVSAVEIDPADSQIVYVGSARFRWR